MDSTLESTQDSTVSSSLDSSSDSSLEKWEKTGQFGSIESKVDRKVKLLKQNPVLVESDVLMIKRNDNQITHQLLEKYFKKYANIVSIDDFGGKGCFYIRFANRYDAKIVLAVTSVGKVTEVLPDNTNWIADQLDINGIKTLAAVIGEHDLNDWRMSVSQT